MGVPGTVSPEALVSLLAKFWMKSRGPAVLSFVSWMLVPGQSTSQSTQLREKALALIVDTPTSLVLGIPPFRISCIYLYRQIPMSTI